MKKLRKKIVSMAAAAAIAAGMIGTGAGTLAASVKASAGSLSDDGIMPLYLRSDTQSFRVLAGSGNSSERFTYTVTGDPVRIKGITCTRGAAYVQVTVSNGVSRRYIVKPGDSWTPREIHCSKGDTVKIFIMPYLADHNAVAQGSFTFQY